MEVDTKTLLQDGDINKDQEELIFDPYNPKIEKFLKHRYQKF